MGLNFKSWIRALRIAESQRLLLEHPGASALEVGEMVGIHGRSTFFAQFSEVTGMSPGESRNPALFFKFPDSSAAVLRYFYHRIKTNAI